MKSELFANELALIKNDTLRTICREYLENAVPSYFWEIGASSSGKYHPCFSQGDGGLVRHTKAVVMFAEELLRMSSYMYMKDIYKDYVIFACIVHDTCKYGIAEYDKTQYNRHPQNAAANVAEFAEGMGYSVSEFLLNAIKGHMGQWEMEKEDRPFTSIDRCVHMADYMASRSFIDIPSLHEDVKA